MQKHLAMLHDRTLILTLHVRMLRTLMVYIIEFQTPEALASTGEAWNSPPRGLHTEFAHPDAGTGRL